MVQFLRQEIRDLSWLQSPGQVISEVSDIKILDRLLPTYLKKKTTRRIQLETANSRLLVCVHTTFYNEKHSGFSSCNPFFGICTRTAAVSSWRSHSTVYVSQHLTPLH